MESKKAARLSVSLDEDIYADLCEIARQEDVSVAWVVRRAVNNLIRGTPANDKIRLALKNKVLLARRQS